MKLATRCPGARMAGCSAEYAHSHGVSRPHRRCPEGKETNWRRPPRRHWNARLRHGVMCDQRWQSAAVCFPHGIDGDGARGAVDGIPSLGWRPIISAGPQHPGVKIAPFRRSRGVLPSAIASSRLRIAVDTTCYRVSAGTKNKDERDEDTGQGQAPGGHDSDFTRDCALAEREGVPPDTPPSGLFGKLGNKL